MESATSRPPFNGRNNGEHNDQVFEQLYMSLFDRQLTTFGNTTNYIRESIIAIIDPIDV